MTTEKMVSVSNDELLTLRHIYCLYNLAVEKARDLSNDEFDELGLLPGDEVLDIITPLINEWRKRKQATE